MERDFANGYLFAEILHRYFPGEVSMHSFDKNASSVHKKRDNWSVLLKPLKKAGFDVTTREWEAICAAEDGAAVTFVGKMHRRLAGGSATMPPPSSASGGSRRTSARFGDGGRRGEDADDRGGDDSWEDAFSARGEGDDHRLSRGESPDDHQAPVIDRGWGRGTGGYGGDAPRGDVDVRGYVASPSKFRFQPGASGGFDWEAYQREYMSPNRTDSIKKDEQWLEGRAGSADNGDEPREPKREDAAASSGRDDDVDVDDVDVDARRHRPRRRPMRPLRDREPSVSPARRSDSDRYDSGTPFPRREPRRGGAPPAGPPARGFDGGASLLDWGPSLPGEEDYGYGEAADARYYEDGDGYDSAGDGYDDRHGGHDYDSAGRHGRSPRRSYAMSRGDVRSTDVAARSREYRREEADRASRERRYREASAGARGHEPNDEPRSERTDSRRRRSERHTPRSREETPASSFGGEKPRGAPGFYNPTFYERKYDLGEARGVSTYERSGAGGYEGARERPSEAQRRARTEGPYAGQYGMDYEPKRVSEYRRMLGEGGAYYKLGSLGGDLDTEAQRAAREKREAIKELDRVNREQNRLAAERSNANMAKKRGIPPRGADGGAANRLEKGFLSHVGDRDPRNPGKNQAPSKHERMWSYAKRHIPKPVPAPPKKAPPAPPRMHGVWKEPAGGAEAFAAAPKDNNFRGEWPSAWGGREDVRGPHQNAPRVDRGRRGMQLQPDAMHDRGQAREMSELERLEMEHRIHQQKLRELSLV